MPFQKLTKKQLRGDAEVPTILRITILDLLQVGRRDTTIYRRAIAHGVKGYRRHDKHKGRLLE